MMNDKILLRLTDDQLNVHSWHEGALSLAHTFTEADHSRLAIHLKECQAPAHLLVDLIEEDFRFESLPHLRGADHQSLVENRLAHLYPGLSLRMALRQRQQVGPEQTDEMLYSALTNPSRLAPWLKILQEQETPLVSIHSASHLCAGLLKEFPSDHVLLFIWEEGVGLRASYFHNRQLRFSRLIPASDLARTLATEEMRIRLYLHGQHLLPGDQPLDIVCLCHTDDRPALEQLLARDPAIRAHFPDIGQQARALGLRKPVNNSDATPLLLHLLATRPPQQHYATAEHTRHFRRRNVRRLLLAVSALSLFASFAWSASNLVQLRQIENENAASDEQVQQLARQTLALTRNAPPLPAPLADIKSVIAQLQTLDKHSPPPQQLLSGLAVTLNDFPLIRVEKLAWQADVPVPKEGTPPRQTLLLYGRVDDATADYRTRLDHQQDFRRALGEHGYQVTEFQPGSPQTGPDAHFILQLTWTGQP